MHALLGHCRLPLCLMIATALCIGAAQAQQREDLRDLHLGMPVNDIPADEYVGLACADKPDLGLPGWADFGRCAAEADGLHAISFQYNESLNPLARVNDAYEGTKVAGHPVLLKLLVNDHGLVEGIHIDTDPHARLFWRKKAFMLALAVKAKYGEDGWQCRELEPSGGETAVGGLFIKEHCEKSADLRAVTVDRALYRLPGQSMKEFVNETHVDIRRLADRSANQ